jgi:hypothetical protein
MAAYNAARAERLKALSTNDLLRIIIRQTLSASAARHELRRRGLSAVQTRTGWFLAPAETWTSPAPTSAIAPAGRVYRPRSRTWA